MLLRLCGYACSGLAQMDAIGGMDDDDEEDVDFDEGGGSDDEEEDDDDSELSGMSDVDDEVRAIFFLGISLVPCPTISQCPHSGDEGLLCLSPGKKRNSMVPPSPSRPDVSLNRGRIYGIVTLFEISILRTT